MRGGELIATDETTIIAKPFLDAIMVEDLQSDRRFPDPPRTDESDWSEGFCKTNDLVDKLVAPETGPRWRGR